MPHMSTQKKPLRVMLNEREAANRLGISHETLRRYRIEGIGPPWTRYKGGRTGRGQIRYHIEWLDQWVTDNTTVPQH